MPYDDGRDEFQLDEREFRDLHDSLFSTGVYKQNAPHNFYTVVFHHQDGKQYSISVYSTEEAMEYMADNWGYEIYEAQDNDELQLKISPSATDRDDKEHEQAEHENRVNQRFGNPATVRPEIQQPERRPYKHRNTTPGYAEPPGPRSTN